jgi:hypothetical protein
MKLLAITVLLALAPVAHATSPRVASHARGASTDRITRTAARRLARQYLAGREVSRIRVGRCKLKSWQGSRVAICHTLWEQGGLFRQPSDVSAYVWVRKFRHRAQCSVAGVPWQRCKHADPFGPFGV